MIDKKISMKYPQTYLHILDCKTGEEWIMLLKNNSILDLKHQIRKWIKQQFGGELYLDGDIISNLEGDYYGKIVTDGRSPDNGIVWDGGGFYLTDECIAFRRNK